MGEGYGDLARLVPSRSWMGVISPHTPRQAVIDAAEAVAGEVGASIAQVSLAWLLAKPHVTSVIFGARGVTQVNITVYGPRTELHSGHYGNWAPNPAMMLAKLL
mgnify:CR=1 FL=1